MFSSRFLQWAEIVNLEGAMMKQDRVISASRKMRGMIDPYTLGFLISIIGAGIAHIVHADRHDDEISNSTQLESQVDALVQIEDE